MTLEDLGNIGEFIAAVGVVVSLVYLAIQVRQNTAHLGQNTRSVRTSAMLEARAASTELPKMVAQDSEVARICTLGFSSPADLSSEERIRFHAILAWWFNNQESIFFLHESDAIDAIQYAPWERDLRQTLGLPGIAEWCRHSSSFSDTFAATVNGMLAEINNEPSPSNQST